ncbi:MAG: pilus assembly protein PilP [Hahellaceae bacterium]|nr:pilus assembly protein PilP [Hahellaceae bacterium]MCP5168833.1 pilus assembly protein PilP [Hahellaceae bacterium]
MQYKILLASSVLFLSGCGVNSSFDDLDRFMSDANKNARGVIEPMPEFVAYQAFNYSAANRRSPFSVPVDVKLVNVVEDEAQNSVKPDLDRPRELLESFAITSLKMVGTLQKQDEQILWALVSDGEGGIHRVKAGQYMGKNHGRVQSIEEGQIDLVEIVPNGHGGWLERPRSIALSDQ